MDKIGMIVVFSTPCSRGWLITQHHLPPQPLDFFAGAIVIQTEGNFTDARRFQLCVRRYALLRSDLSKKPATSRRCHPNNTAAPTLGEHNEIVLRDYLGYFSGSGLSKAWACSIRVSGKARFDSCCGASWTAAEYRNRFNSIPGDMMLRTIQVEKLVLGLCVVIFYALLRTPQAMSAAKVTTPSDCNTWTSPSVTAMLPKPAIRCQFTTPAGCKTRTEARGGNLIPAKTAANHSNLRLDKVRSSKVGMKGYKG
jgi:hypothetical protein